MVLLVHYVNVTLSSHLRTHRRWRIMHCNLKHWMQSTSNESVVYTYACMYICTSDLQVLECLAMHACKGATKQDNACTTDNTAVLCNAHTHARTHAHTYTPNNQCTIYTSTTLWDCTYFDGRLQVCWSNLLNGHMSTTPLALHHCGGQLAFPCLLGFASVEVWVGGEVRCKCEA